MIGEIVSHYRILEEIRGGGMAKVYKAQDVKLERWVALKFLKSDLQAGDEEKQRFIHEARAASALDHQNICTIYEIGETASGRMFIAMAYYDGGSLKDKISHESIGLKDCIALTIQIAQGLAKAHERGIIHRDFKPGNVMLTSDGVAKIVDFGLAKLADAQRLTPTGTTLGTPAYMSPEQARMIDVDLRTDIWSLGVVLYEMLSGHLPFRGNDYLALLYNIVNEQPEPLQNYVPDLPAGLARMVDRALKKSIDARYPSLGDMLGELREMEKELAKEESGRAVVFSPTRGRVTQGGSKEGASKLQSLIEQTLTVAQAPTSPAGSNPYLNRVRIQNPEEFYGRSSELSRIYERIKAGRPQSVSLVGVRRIGKSSVLSAIHHPVNRKKYLPNPQEYAFVFMDMQEKRNVEPAELLQHIFSALQKEFRGALELNVKPDYEGLKQVVHVFQDANLKLILLWDEFESVTRNPKIGPEFYAYFRSLANNFNVAYITTSSAQLQNLCHTKEIADSPFFNIFTNLHLSAFKLDEAKKLIAEPSAKAGKPLASHLDFILEMAGHFPFFIQIACAALFSLDRIDNSSYKKVKEIFMEEAGPHFQEYWEKFDESQKAVMAALTLGKKPPREHAFAIKDVAQAGFVLNEKLFSTAFAEFIRENAQAQQPWWKVW